MLRGVMPTRVASSAMVIGQSTDDGLTVAPPRRNSPHDIARGAAGHGMEAGCAATGVTAHPVVITLADADTKSCKDPRVVSRVRAAGRGRGRTPAWRSRGATSFRRPPRG